MFHHPVSLAIGVSVRPDPGSDSDSDSASGTRRNPYRTRGFQPDTEKRREFLPHDRYLNM